MQKDIAEKIDALKKTKPAPPPDLISDINNCAVTNVSDEEDVLQSGWTKQRYSTQQLLRKMDAVRQIFRLCLITGARCSFVVRAFAHGAMGRRINPSWGGPIELFLVPASAPRLV